MDNNLDGYVLASGQQAYGDYGEIGIKIFVKASHAVSDEERWQARKAVDVLHEFLLKEALRLDPSVHAHAAKRKAEIVALFPSPIYVEEIPNGYCSRACCALYPWFVVTTHRGRITIGWRKSVLSIDWSDSEVKAKADDLFADQGIVTRFDQTTHAWGYDKAREYIQRILAWQPAPTVAA